MDHDTYPINIDYTVAHEYIMKSYPINLSWHLHHD